LVPDSPGSIAAATSPHRWERGPSKMPPGSHPTKSDSPLAASILRQGRYPVMVSDVLTDDEPIAEIEPTELTPPQIVDLDEWFILPAEADPTAETEPRIIDQA